MTAKTATAGRRLRAVVAEAGHPIARSLQLLIGNSGPSIIELAATREHLRLGTAPADGARTPPTKATTSP